MVNCAMMLLGPAYSDGLDLACSYIATKSYNRSIALTRNAPHRQAPWPYRGGQTGLGFRIPPHCAQFRYPKLNACVCRSRHTHALTPFSANWPPNRGHRSIRRQRFRTIAIHPSTQFSHHTDNHRIKASRALDHRTVWHGLRAITTHPSTRRCDQCLSLEWNNNPSLRRSMLRAVTFDARFSVYSNAEDRRKGHCTRLPPPAGLEDARPPDRPSNQPKACVVRG